MSVMLYRCIFCVARLIDILGVVVILLLNIMEVLSVGGGALLDRRVCTSKECMCCACDHSVHLGVPSIDFVYICVCRE